MEFLTWLEQTALATWVRESPSLWAYPTVLMLHGVGLAMLVGAKVVVDLRLLGFAPRVPVAPMEPLFLFMWIGFWINAVSGVALFTADATTRATQTIFIIKLTLIALGMVNIALVRTAVFGDRHALAANIVSRKARILAAASIVIWAGAITAGRLVAYL